MKRSPERIFERASALAGREREAYLRKATGADRRLRGEIESLLAAQDRFPDSLRRPASGAFSDSAGGGVERVGPYELVSEIGRGGMGVVYLARDPRLDRMVAIKALPEWLRGDPRELERFEREARLLAAMNHPTIATIHALEPARGSIFLVMEYVAGESLARRLASGPVPTDECLRIGREIAMALEAAHRNGIAHLDLKPDNLILSSEGRVKLLDFGLARPLDDVRDPKAASAASIPLVRGTPGYVSPEQLRGAAGDHRSDLFALGCVLYECCAGRPAFPGRTARARMAATLRARPDWKALPSSTPEALRELLVACLAGEPDARCDTAARARRILEGSMVRRSLLSAPPVWPESVIPNNVPARLDRFIGRKPEQARLVAALRLHRMITLGGAGGSGKTRMALETARHLLAAKSPRARSALADGIWLVELAAVRDVASSRRAIAGALGVAERRGKPLAQALEEHLASRRVLLVLDNCEQLPAAFSSFVNALLAKAPGLRILATSRTALAVRGERMIRVPPLALPARRMSATSLARVPAVALFVDRAQAAEPGFRLRRDNARSVAELCRRLDGVPLALELAAARTASLPLSEILRTLLAPSPARKRKTAEDRHRTLDALVDWSYRLLSASERRFFRRLAVFAGPFTLDAAESVCTGDGLEPWDALDLLSELVRKSLIEIAPPPRAGAGEDRTDGPMRYRMLAIVRRFAAIRLARTEEAADLKRRHRDFFLALAREAARHARGPEQGVWLARLALVQEDLRSAVEASARGGEIEVALRFGSSLGWFWNVRGEWTEGRRILLAILSAPDPSGGSTEATRARANAHTWAGNFALNLGKLPEAQGSYEAAIDAGRTVDDRMVVARALSNLGAVAILRGEFERATTVIEQAITIQKALGDPSELAVLCLNLGVVAERRGDLDRASQLYRESLDLRERKKDPFSIALSLSNVGIIEEKRGNLNEAQALHERALRIRRRLEDRRGIAESLHNLSAVLFLRKRTARAAQGFAESLRLRRELGDELGIAASLEAIALVLAPRDPVRCAQILGHCDALRERLAAPRSATGLADRDRVLGLLESKLPAGPRERALRDGALLSTPKVVAAALSALPSGGR